MAQRQHKHRIDVQTDEPLVTVTIGSDGGVPGGFAKLFNRVVDSEVWAHLSEAAKAVYVPMVRFADHRNQFRVKIGQAGLIKYSGLSRSSIKRAMKDLLNHRLIVVIERGGVSDSGENESNTYQLLVPAEGRRKTGGRPDPNPMGVRQRTPSGFMGEPADGPEADGEPGPLRTAAGADRTADRGFSGGPQLRTQIKELNNKTVSPSSQTPPPPVDAAVLLESNGVDAAVARQLAAQFPHDRIVDVVATMQWRRARGKCDNPGGFIRDALVRQWETPRPVVDARVKAEARLKAQTAERAAKVSAAREQSCAAQEEARIERAIDSLEDEDLQLLAESVREKYRGNAAVTAVLNRKPPRECRLMKMEIASMLGESARI